MSSRARPNKEKIQQNPNVVWREINGETLLIPITSEVADLQHIYVLNKTGAYIWQTLARPLNSESLTAKVCHQFHIKPEQVENDLKEFLKELEQNRLIIKEVA